MNSELETHLANIDKKLGYVLGNQVAILEWQEKNDKRRRNNILMIKNTRRAMYFSLGSFALLFALYACF